MMIDEQWQFAFVRNTPSVDEQGANRQISQKTLRMSEADLDVLTGSQRPQYIHYFVTTEFLPGLKRTTMFGRHDMTCNLGKRRKDWSCAPPNFFKQPHLQTSSSSGLDTLV